MWLETRNEYMGGHRPIDLWEQKTAPYKFVDTFRIGSPEKILISNLKDQW